MKTKVLLTALLVVLMAPVWVMAGQVEGTIQGFSCVVQGKACPIDREDPLVTFERNFVVLTFNGDYYLIPNLDRAILARHLRERVRIKGIINKKYRSIEAEKLEVWKGSAWKTTWSKEMEEEIKKFLGLGT
jgi:hypothetical protein